MRNLRHLNSLSVRNPEDETELRAFGEFCANLQPN
jgi:hypothetical protein